MSFRTLLVAEACVPGLKNEFVSMPGGGGVNHTHAWCSAEEDKLKATSCTQLWARLPLLLCEPAAGTEGSPWGLIAVSDEATRIGRAEAQPLSKITEKSLPTARQGSLPFAQSSIDSSAPSKACSESTRGGI